MVGTNVVRQDIFEKKERESKERKSNKQADKQGSVSKETSKCRDTN